MRLAGDFHQKFFSKNFKIKIFWFFWKVFGWERWVFCGFQLGKNGFQNYGYPFGYFWRCKIDEILTIMSFYPWFSVWNCLFGFLQKFATFFASVHFCVFIFGFQYPCTLIIVKIWNGAINLRKATSDSHGLNVFEMLKVLLYPLPLQFIL